MEVLDVEKKGDKKGEKEEGDAKLEILGACKAFGLTCNNVQDWDDAERYLKRAKEGYEEHLGRDSEKALETTRVLMVSTADEYSDEELIERLRDLVKRMERALGVENVVTLDTLNRLGILLEENGEYDEAKEVHERCLAGRMKVLGEDHKETLDTLNNLGVVYDALKNYEKALNYYERASKAKEKSMGKAHPSTLMTVMNIALVYMGTKHYVKATELFENGVKGFEAQYGKDHEYPKKAIGQLKDCLEKCGNEEKLAKLKRESPWLDEGSDDESESEEDESDDEDEGSLLIEERDLREGKRKIL